MEPCLNAARRQRRTPRRPHRSRSTISRRRAGALAGAIVETDCDWSRTLSAILGCKVWLKFENQQFTASFKERGALNRLSALSAAERKARRHRHVGRQSRPGRRLSCAPAGDPRHHRHAGQYADGEGRQHPPARRRGDPDRRDGRGGGAFAHRHGAANGLTFIHPYDDPLVIAGQGTLALEMLGSAPGDRHPRRTDRRRRPDLGHRRGRQGPAARLRR